jgi:eukaryotic-like serine/threonine-protein kinase
MGVIMNTSPRRLGQYELQELLGRGFQTEVWKAADVQEHRYVTIKLFYPQAEQATTRDRPYEIEGQATTRDRPYEAEAQAIIALHHPNIVQMHNFQVAQPPEVANMAPYVVVDYVKGRSLADYIMNTSRMGRFPSAAEIVRLLHPICVAIDYAHQQGVVHHDIKPSNIMLAMPASASQPIPMLTDFGIVQLLQAVNWPERSASYVAPEQTQGYLDNKRSDVYALGVILYEMFTGTLPFEGDDPSDTITQHVSATPTPPVLINPNILPAITAIIMRSLAKDPATRYASAGAMIASLARAANIPLPIAPLTRKDEFGQPSLAYHTDEAMNSPTYLIPGRSVGTTPSLPLLPAMGNTPASPPPGSSSGSLSIQPTLTGGSEQVMSRSAQPGTPSNTSSPGLPSTDKDLPTLITPSPYPMSQGREPMTPMPPLHVSEFPTRISDASTRTPQLPTRVPDASTRVPARGTPTDVPPAPGRPQGIPLPWTNVPQKRGRRPLLIALLALLIIVLLGSGLGSYFVFFARGNTGVSTTPPIVGHAFFISSGLLSTNPADSQGITDQLQINMQKLPPPHAGKAYYAWLLNEAKLDWKPIYLGTLTPRADGTASITFAGDAAHTNLLASNSRFLITEEDSGALPPSPSLDSSTWRYYAAFSQRPNPSDPRKFSLYDHMRHLLSADPNLSAVGLTGGLDIWLYRNTEKILEWSGSARDAWKNKNAANAEFMRRQLERILAYLDGSTYYQKELPGQPLLVDQTIAKVALLEFDVQNQTPPGYLYHITKHLHEITQLSDTSSEQKALAIQIDKAVSNVNEWLKIVHTDALQLYKMTDDQLFSNEGRTLLNDLAAQANNAFIGQIDPFTHLLKDGVVQIHYNSQRLATFDIRACTSSDPCSV